MYCHGTVTTLCNSVFGESLKKNNLHMNEKLRAYLYLHFCVFIWGFTAILGKLISLQALPLVWWRVALCCAALVFMLPKGSIRQMPRARMWELLGIGVIVAIHWLGFYGAIKIANASVGVASMATTSLFAALVEPLILRQRVKWFELGLGLFILPGVLLVVGNIDWTMRMGFAVGCGAALLAAIFTSLNKRILNSPEPPHPLAMSFMQLFGVLLTTSLLFVVLNPWLPPMQWTPQGYDWIWLPVLAWACTLLPYYLTLIAMRQISAFATNLTINLEPVYGILLAAALFQEHLELSSGFYVGMGIILLAVFSHPFLKTWSERRSSQRFPI